MAAGFQQQVIDPNGLQAGVASSILIASFEDSAIAFTDLAVGKFCFDIALDATKIVAQQTRTIDEFVCAGIVWRTNTQGGSNFYKPDKSNPLFARTSGIVEAGANAQIITRGTLAVYADNDKASGLVTPSTNDVVWAGVNGEVFTVPSGGSSHIPNTAQQTSYRVVFVIPEPNVGPNPPRNNLILITNISYVGV